MRRVRGAIKGGGEERKDSETRLSVDSSAAVIARRDVETTMKGGLNQGPEAVRERDRVLACQEVRCTMKRFSLLLYIYLAFSPSFEILYTASRFSGTD